jgi:hypothetical protein
LNTALRGNVEDVRSTPIALGALVFVLVLSALAGTSPATAATPCWKAVIADWSDNGAIDGTYTASCYGQAMQNAPTDLRVYSTLLDDLQKALRQHTARRLAGTHTAPVNMDGAGDSSSFTMLVALLGGLAALLALAWAGAMVVRRLTAP